MMETPLQNMDTIPDPWIALGLFILATLISLLVRRLGRMDLSNRWRRWTPLVHTFSWSIAILVTTILYAPRLGATWIVVIIGLLLAVIVLNASWLRSATAGALLALESRFQVGDAIKVNDVEGTVINFGIRSVEVRSADGTHHSVPNEAFIRDSVATLGADGADAACEIRVLAPSNIPSLRLREMAQTCAILSPLASPRHRPDVFLEITTADQPIEVRIRAYAFDSLHREHYRSDVMTRFFDMMREETSSYSSTGT